jgi:dimethylaniline monooxygenase (N-oxide forming)
MATRIAVIGAGPLGLMAMKTLKEDGFDVTGYEARPYVGGLWKYFDDAYISVLKGTIFNSSRYRAPVSDFPFKDNVDDYPTWQQLYDYLQDYCDHFGLRELINLSCQVVGLTRKGNQWMLEVMPKGAPPRYDYFDKVCVAIGSFVKPKQPIFEGIEKFDGCQLHAINFHHPEKFDDRNVLIIGLHASAQDVACALQGHAKQVYLSHRNGVHLVSSTRSQ